jgi:DNA-binding CsgD family transcriptional regulator
LDAALGSGLVEEGASPTELSFVHPLYRAAILGDLSPAGRRELHARAADSVAGRTRLIHLVEAAVEPDEDLADQLETAAKDSALVGDASTSAWALERAASVSGAPDERDRRLLDAAVIHLNAADAVSAARVLASCQSSGARRDALGGLLGVYNGSPDTEQRLLRAWEGHDPQAEREIGSRAATSLANWMVIAGRPEEALLWGQRAVTAAGENSPVWTLASTALAYGFAAAGRSPEGLAVLRFLPGAANEARASETDALIMRGILRLYTDDLSGSIADLGVAASRLRSGMPSSYPGTCLAHLSDAYFRRGDWDAAVTQAQLATSLAQDGDRPLDLARAHGRAAQVLAYQGQRSAAEAHVHAARSAADRFPQVLTAAVAAVAAVALAFAQGALIEVLAATERVRAAGRIEFGGCPGIFNWRATEIDALIGLGRIDEARGALGEFERAIPRFGLPSASLMLARTGGNLATAVGDTTGAADAFARAHLLAAAVSMPFEHALLSLHDGRRLRIAGQTSEAVEQLEGAHRMFSSLGADPFVVTCSTELATLQVSAPTDSAGSALGLSRAEFAVARLAASGRTNKEAAAELYVSVKTVEYHLRNSYMKLGISSRRQLTDLLR